MKRCEVIAGYMLVGNGGPEESSGKVPRYPPHAAIYLEAHCTETW